MGVATDSFHIDAGKMLDRCGSERVLTTNLVVGETWTLLRRRDGHRAAVLFIDRINDLSEDGDLTVHPVTAAEETAAWDWLRRHDEREYSFVDAVSFEVMRARQITEALAFDNDFAAAGFIQIQP